MLARALARGLHELTWACKSLQELARAKRSRPKPVGRDQLSALASSCKRASLRWLCITAKILWHFRGYEQPRRDARSCKPVTTHGGTNLKKKWSQKYRNLLFIFWKIVRFNVSTLFFQPMRPLQKLFLVISRARIYFHFLKFILEKFIKRRFLSRLLATSIFEKIGVTFVPIEFFQKFFLQFLEHN